MDTSACCKSIQNGHCGAGHPSCTSDCCSSTRPPAVREWFWKFSGLRICANLSWRCHAFDLRSAMQPDLVLWKLSWVVIHVGQCTSTPPPSHGRHLSSGCDLRSSVQAFNQIALADFLDLNLFPQTSTLCTCLVCTVQTTSDCANQPVNQLDGHVPTTSELSWKSVDCDWWLVDSSASFSASSSETASHYGGTSPFPADPGNFLPQMEAVFLWSRSQLLKLSFGHRINMIVVKSRSKCIFIAWLMDHVVNNSHTELGFDTFWWLEASGFKALFLELFSDSFQLMIQHVFLKTAHGCKMVLMSTQVLLKEPSIQVEHQMPMQPVFLAYNRNRRVTEWRSHHDLPPQWFWCQKSAEIRWFWGWSPRGVMPAGEPWCPQGIHLKGSEASSGNSKTCLAWSFSISRRFTRFIGIAQLFDLEESRKWLRHWLTESGLLGPLSNNHAMEVHTDSEEAVGALSGEADVGRPLKIDKSSQGQSVGVAEGAVRKIKGISCYIAYFMERTRSRQADAWKKKHSHQTEFSKNRIQTTKFASKTK